ncbi:hypothetical protein AR276_04745 [Stenotrophomonas maltophilia]|nr:hypothetical protein AR276_04745 [Stenotrophomonas maltophilia]
MQQRADAGGQLGLVAAVAGQPLAQRAFLGRWQHCATVDALAQALRGQLAQVAADRIFGHGIAARQLGGNHAALLAQFLQNLPGALGGEGAGIGAHAASLHVRALTCNNVHAAFGRGTGRLDCR